MILSASRRTDIPTFYPEWFLNRLKAGEVYTRNPVNHRQITRLLFSPDTVDCIVIWTKDPANLMPFLPEIDALGYRYYFQFTLTPYGREIERNLREKIEIVKTFQELSRRIGKDRVIWRYDPIIFNQSMDLIYHVDRFTELCQELADYTDTCVISFVDLYYKNEPAVKQGLLRPISEEEMRETCQAFAQIAAQFHINVKTCCETLDFSAEGVVPGACVDKELIEKLCGYPLDLKPDPGQRENCLCHKSFDMGAYNTCANGCVYCYANYSGRLVSSNLETYDRENVILCGRVLEGEPVIERLAQSSKNLLDQISFY